MTSEPTRAPERDPAIPALLLLTGATLALGLSLPALTLRRLLARRTYSVVAGILELARDGNVLLAGVVLLFSVVFPIAKLGLLTWIYLGRGDAQRRGRALPRLELLGKWSMLDVFVIVIFLGTARLGILSDAEPLGIHVFGLAVLLSMVTTFALARLHDVEPEARAGTVRLGSRSGRWISLAALSSFLAGLTLPLMSVEAWLFWDRDYSVLGATLALLGEGEAPLALAVLAFVVLAPGASMAVLLAVRWRASIGPAARRRLARLQRWAMLEVFALALLVAAIQLGTTSDVRPRPGLWLLAAALALSLIDAWRLRAELRRAGVELNPRSG